jgi:hypothetical protein
VNYAVSRRRFLEGVGASAIWAALVSKLEAQAEGAASPKRFLVIQRPVGTVYENWWPKSNGANFPLSRILTSFQANRERMIVLRDLKLPHEGSVGGGHERGSVLMLTGQRTKVLYPGNGGDDPQAEGPSVDQLFLKQSKDLQGPPIASLQLSCDNRADTPEVSTRHMSYSGARAPMKPYYQPRDAYQRLFGAMAGSGNAAALAQARLEQKSVLDFSLKDLARLRKLVPASQLAALEAHEMAIRELEKELDQDPNSPTSCGVPMEPETVSISTYIDPYSSSHVVKQRDDEKHDRIAQLHFALIKAAFRCDLTRVITFQFSPGTNHVSFAGMWPPDPTVFKVHHTTSHDPDTPDTLEFLTRIESWYADRVNKLLTELNTPDGTGAALMDNMLVPYVTEVGARYHNWDNMPFLLFGGKNTKLRGNTVWTNGANGGRGLRSTNDLWMALAGYYGLTNFTLGDNDQHTTAMTGLFT